MELLINALSDPNLWQGNVQKSQTEFDDLIVDGQPSTMFRVSNGEPFHITFAEPVDLTGYTAISFNVSSFQKMAPADKSNYVIDLDGVPYQVPITKRMNRVVLPLTAEQDTLTTLTIIPQFTSSDILVVAHLIAIKPELPTDILQAFKRGIERELVLKGDKLPVGNVDCRSGDSRVTLEGEWDWLERNVVLIIGDELHQVANKVDNYVTFLTTYDGETIGKNYTGEIYVMMPVEIGYFDREIVLPGIALWYNSPRPNERQSLTDKKVLCVIDGEYVEERAGAIMNWRITMEIVARSPQLVQIAARCVRAFLGQSVIWVNGVKLWWFWKDPVADSEPIEDYDIVPRANYHVEVEVMEEVWELQSRAKVKSINLKAHLTLNPLLT